jgi:hypothetical protein
MPVVKWQKYDTEEFREGDANECVGSLASVRKEKTRNRIGEVLEKLTIRSPQSRGEGNDKRNL